MKKGILVFSVFSMLIFSVPVWAEEFEENLVFREEQQVLSVEDTTVTSKYPSEMDYELVSPVVKFESSTTPGESPSENVFTVDDNGKKTSYIILDKDGDGNYFVLTETEFGQKGFTSLATEDINDFETLDSLWYFDPTNESSIAYWLNNSFLTSGNGGVILPESVKDNILERDWVIENNVVADNSTRPTDESTAKVNEYKLSRGGVRTVTSKLSLLSYTEYKTYSDKISAPSTRNVDADKPLGFMTRTIRSTVSGRRNDLTFSNYFLHICGANDQTYVTCEVNGNFDNNYYVRPVFWLDKDFFKNEKIELSTAGENVKDEVIQHLYADLTYIYSDDELECVGIDADALPKAENVVVSGLKMPGSTPEIEYRYLSDDAEVGSIYEIYSVGENDEFTLEEIQTGKWTIPENLAGKTVKVAVIPSDENGKKGARAWSNTFTVKEASGIVISDSEFKDADENPLSTLSGATSIQADVSIVNNDTQGLDCTIIIAQYNSENQLKAVEVSSVVAVSGDNFFGALLSGISVDIGDYVRVMVKANSKPIYSKVIK